MMKYPADKPGLQERDGERGLEAEEGGERGLGDDGGEEKEWLENVRSRSWRRPKLP